LVQQFRHERRPAGLVTGTDAGTGVAVEILVEGNQIVPVRIALELRGVLAVHPPGEVQQELVEDALQEFHKSCFSRTGTFRR